MKMEDPALPESPQIRRRSLAKAFASGEAVGFFLILVILMLRDPFDPDLPWSLACSLTTGVGIVMGLGYFIGLATLSIRTRSVGTGIRMAKPAKAWLFGVVCGTSIVIGAIIGNKGRGTYTFILVPVIVMVLSPIIGVWWLVQPERLDGESGS